MDLPTSHLMAFLAIAESGSFTEAARRLAVSQPALSRTVRLLEDSVGARLFDRDTRNVSLTPAGHELRPIAERILADLEAASASMEAFVQGRRGLIRIAALPSLAAHLLPEAIATFMQTRPQVRFRIDDALSASVFDAVEGGLADFGLTIRPPADRNLAFRPIARDPAGLVCRRDDPLAAASELDWSAFADRPFVAMARTSSVRAMTDAAFLQAGISVEPLYECSFLASAGALVEAGLGITALPELTLNMALTPELVWRPLRAPTLLRETGVVHRRGRAHSAAVTEFIGVLAAIAARRSS